MNERNDNGSNDGDTDAIADARADGSIPIDTGSDGSTGGGPSGSVGRGSSDSDDSQGSIRSGMRQDTGVDDTTGRIGSGERATEGGSGSSASSAGGSAGASGSDTAGAQDTGEERQTQARTWVLGEDVVREVNDNGDTGDNPNPDDASAPFGYKADGTPRKRRGRKPRDVSFDVVRPGPKGKVSYKDFATELSGLAFFVVGLCRPGDVNEKGENLWPLTRAEGEKLGEKIDLCARTYVGLNPKLAKALDKYAPLVSLTITAVVITGPRIIGASRVSVQRRQAIQARERTRTTVDSTTESGSGSHSGNGTRTSATPGVQPSNQGPSDAGTQRDTILDRLTGLDL